MGNFDYGDLLGQEKARRARQYNGEKYRKLRNLLDSEYLEGQTLADDILTGLPTVQLEEFFEYCREMWKMNGEKKYYNAMVRIFWEAKNRRLKLQANSLPVAEYVEELISKRLNWGIAAYPPYNDVDVKKD